MRIRPFRVGQTMDVLAIRSFILWVVLVSRVTAGQELILTRQYDNLKPTEIRLDSRGVRWMDFAKPERQPQQVRPQDT